MRDGLLGQLEQDLPGQGEDHRCCGSGNYSVKVTNVKLERYPAGKRVTMRTTKDYDGWHSTGDSAATSSVSACKYPHDSWRVVATFSWRKGTASEDNAWRPDMSWVGC